MFSVVSVYPPLQTCSLGDSLPPPPRPPGPVQTCSFKKLREWPSTERPSQWLISHFPDDVAPTLEFETKTYYLTRFLPKTA